MNEEKEKNSLPFLIIVIITVWIIATVIIWFVFKDWNQSGPFGDTFGAVNSLFSGLALAGIIYTIHLQKTELSLQRKELQYTREELKRTADAQESSGKLMNEQLRINNIPFFEYSFGDGKKKALLPGQKKHPVFLSISNNSENPAVDLDVWLFINVDNIEYSIENFTEDFIRADLINTAREKISSVDMLDDEWYFVADRGIYNYLPKNNKIKIPLDYYPFDFNYFQVFLQYRDVLGNNYFQHASFTDYSNSPDPYINDVLEPLIPKVIDRFKFNQKDIPKEFEELNKIKKCSLYKDWIIGEQERLVESKWEIVKLLNNS